MMDLMKLFSAQDKFKSFKSQIPNKGFTLIELLVVIGILGILAAALVATIDPFEQLKKADDSKIKNMAVEFQTANIRYYTTHGAFPWNDLSPDADCSTATTQTTFSQTLFGDEMLACLGAKDVTKTLIGEGELKPAFTSNESDLGKVIVNWDVLDPTNMSVCFAPDSKSQLSNDETKYDSDGTDLSGGACAPNVAIEDKRTVCFWCTK